MSNIAIKVENLGIIDRNGAGKPTLLKVLSCKIDYDIII